MEELMDGEASAVQVAALLAMLRVRGESPEELAAFARVMRARVVRVEAPEGAVDLCGTGADGLHTLNVSTLAAFVVAGAGTPVAKHGNRAITSRCGSADLIEALGIPLDPGPEAVGRAIAEVGFGFMFAPSYHPAMRHVMPIRRELPMRTAFNLLGPISSPAGVRRQLLGVADPRLLSLLAGALARLGTFGRSSFMVPTEPTSCRWTGRARRSSWRASRRASWSSTRPTSASSRHRSRRSRAATRR